MSYITSIDPAYTKTEPRAIYSEHSIVDDNVLQIEFECGDSRGLYYRDLGDDPMVINTNNVEALATKIVDTDFDEIFWDC